MANVTLIPVCSSKENAVKKIASAKVDFPVDVVTLLEVFSSSGATFHIEEEDRDVIAGDICFLQMSPAITEDRQKELIHSLKMNIAPIYVQFDTPTLQGMENMSEQEQELFGSLADELDDEALVSGGDFSMNDIVRALDSSIRTMDLAQFDSPIAVSSANRITDRLLPPGAAIANVLFFPLTETEEGEGFSFDVSDPEVCVSSRVVRLSYEVQEDTEVFLFELDEDGSVLLLDSAQVLYLIESMTPGVVMVVSGKDYKSYVQSWIIHHDQLDGGSKQFTEKLLSDFDEEFFEVIFKDDKVTASAAPDIAGSVHSLLGAMFSDEDTAMLMMALDQSIDDDEDGDDDDDDF